MTCQRSLRAALLSGLALAPFAALARGVEFGPEMQLGEGSVRALAEDHHGIFGEMLTVMLGAAQPVAALDPPDVFAAGHCGSLSLLPSQVLVICLPPKAQAAPKAINARAGGAQAISTTW